MMCACEEDAELFQVEDLPTLLGDVLLFAHCVNWPMYRAVCVCVERVPSPCCVFRFSPPEYCVRACECVCDASCPFPLTVVAYELHSPRNRRERMRLTNGKSTTDNDDGVRMARTNSKSIDIGVGSYGNGQRVHAQFCAATERSFPFQFAVWSSVACSCTSESVIEKSTWNA